MANLILFHSVLGLRPSIFRFADKLREKGHIVYTPDLYFGEVFDDLEIANRKFSEIGISEMMSRSISVVQGLPTDSVYGGFSNGGASAELLACTQSEAKGCLLFHSALPINMLQIDQWPSKVPVQIHYSKNDPFRNDGFIATLSESIKKSGSKVEYFEYEHGGHLFTDEDFRDYDQQSAQKLIKNVSWFLESI
ncbi:MAG: dienelactone hydrolase family protein [Anaerolineales bacterium]